MRLVKGTVMGDLVQFTKSGNIAVITINNPPVNALSPGVPEGISEAIGRVEQDGSIHSVVVIGGGRTFIAGADIKDLEQAASGQRTDGGPNMHGLLAKIEDCSKPVIMAI